MSKHPNNMVIGGIAALGLLSSVLSIIQAGFGLYKGDFGNLNTFLYSLIGTIIALAAICAYLSIRNINLYKDYCNAPQELKKNQKRIGDLIEALNKERAIQNKIAKTFHNFSHEYRAQIFNIHQALIKKDSSLLNSIKSSFKSFLIYMIENIKDSFDVYTGLECSVCIKLLDEKLYVRTFLRDSVSFRSREEVSKRLVDGYSYKDNTAFFTIMETPNSYFVNNDLKGLQKQYRNANESWIENYNASIVVPIRLVDKSTKTNENSKVIGFICVDSMKGNFNNTTCVDMLAAYADHCYNLFVLYYTYDKMINALDSDSKL